MVEGRNQHRWDAARDAFRRVYGSQAEAIEPLIEQILAEAIRHRPSALVRLDQRREADPDWFQSNTMVGYVCYTDLFAGTLRDVAAHLDYLAELGVTYLHLMPVLRPRDGENDGGYAVANYEEVDPRLGSMDDLEWLAEQLRDRGISLCIDLVMNHTAQEHPWAQAALRGDPAYANWYHFFPNRDIPDRYEASLREVFPAFKPGNFSWVPEAKTWVWTTFNEYQWDLNYANPNVFAAMLRTMLVLVNRGVEVLRLDAVPFLWKRMGTDCENQPEAHLILQALKHFVAIVAPGVQFKAEAIVSPDALKPYLGAGEPEHVECDAAYHNQLMVMLWSSLATKDALLMAHSLDRMGPIPGHSSWVTYVRCHDDIGWAVTDDDAHSVGWNGAAHRRFLNEFYSGVFPGSYARGAYFQMNSFTGDARISGTAASLCGIEQALEEGVHNKLQAAFERLELLYAVAMSFGGTPLIYMGDELGLRNDPTFEADPAKSDDNRWLHRPRMDWDVAARRRQAGTTEHRLFSAMVRLTSVRATIGSLNGGATTEVRFMPDRRLFCFERSKLGHRPAWMLANFGEESLSVSVDELALSPSMHVQLAGNGATLAGRSVSLPPRGYVWLS